MSRNKSLVVEEAVAHGNLTADPYSLTGEVVVKPIPSLVVSECNENGERTTEVMKNTEKKETPDIEKPKRVRRERKKGNAKATMYLFGLRKVFHYYKTGEEKLIDGLVLQEVFDEMGYEITISECERFLKEVDEDNNGIISLSEFVNFILFGIMHNKLTEKDILASFEKFDVSSNGMIGIQEFRRAMSNLGNPLQDEEIDKLILKHQNQNDKNGELDYVEMTSTIFQNISLYQNSNLKLRTIAKSINTKKKKMK